MDERRKITGQLGVRDGRTKYPFVSLRGNFLRGTGNDDLRGDKAGVDEVVRRLKVVAPKAERAGVALGGRLRGGRGARRLRLVGHREVRIVVADR